MARRRASQASRSAVWGFATVRADGTRRLYAVGTEPLQAIDAWLERFRRRWEPHLDALGTEIARGKRARRSPTDPI
jgi:hypothetical protein